MLRATLKDAIGETFVIAEGQACKEQARINIHSFHRQMEQDDDDDNDRDI